MIFPLQKSVTINDTLSFLDSYKVQTEIPVGIHPGSFGFVRKNHIHEGVDLYAENGDSVLSMLNGKVLAIIPFTGEIAGSPWWENTYSVFVEHDNFLINYGEITPAHGIKVGSVLLEGDLVGSIKTVLKVNKGRPMSMLHLEMYKLGTTEPIKEWMLGIDKPESLLDPTGLLLSFVR